MTYVQIVILTQHSNPVALQSTVQVVVSTKPHTFFCSYLQAPSILSLHFCLLHVTLRYFAPVTPLEHACMYTRYCKMGCNYPLQRRAELSDMRLCISWVELKLHKQCIYSVFRVARETEKVVFFTELSLNGFCPKK